MRQERDYVLIRGPIAQGPQITVEHDLCPADICTGNNMRNKRHLHKTQSTRNFSQAV